MKASELLREAKQHLWDGAPPRPPMRGSGLCIALAFAETRLRSVLGEDCRASVRICARIQEALGSQHAFVSHWLIANVPEAAALSVSDPDQFARALYEYRLRWMDHLANEFEQEGD